VQWQSWTCSSDGCRLVSARRSGNVATNSFENAGICRVKGAHKWVKTGYPPGSDGEASGFFLRCRRCGKENHDTGIIAGGPAGAAGAWGG